MNTFEERYEKLNRKQQEAVDKIYGPVLVIAGPGSGKTELLSMRAANILRLTDANPGNILCLTFTDKATKNMRERLASIIGQDAYRVNIETFHSFGSEILNRYKYRIADVDELIPIDDIETSIIFDSIQDTLAWNDPWKGKNVIRDLQYAIGLIKNAGISTEEYHAIIETNNGIIEAIGRSLSYSMETIFSLGMRNDEKIEKWRRFEIFFSEMKQVLDNFPNSHGIQDSWKRLFLESITQTLDARMSETHTKPLTAWKNKWLMKDYLGGWTLKEKDQEEKFMSLSTIYTLYEKSLKEKGYIDFSDMIIETIHLIETYPDIRANIAEQYQWIMIDEFQDTNDAQMRLITNILTVDGEKPNIFAVGDDDQSIFKFQGASTKNIREFHDRWEDTHLILLEENYRSHEEIIHASRTVMVQSLYKIGAIFPDAEKKFTSFRGVGGYVKYQKYSSEYEEVVGVTNIIQKLLEKESIRESIAIISKKNSFLEVYAQSLIHKGIPVSLSREVNIFEVESVRLLKDILLYLASLASIPRDELLVTILSHPMWCIPRLTLWKLSKDITHARKSERKDWLEMLRTHNDSSIRTIANFMIELSLLASYHRLEDIIDFVTGANELMLSSDYDDDREMHQLSIQFGNERILYRSPFFSFFFGIQREKNPTQFAYHLGSIRTLIERIRSIRRKKGIITLQDFEHFLHLIEKYSIPILFTETLGTEKDAVQCLTIHKAKGLEFDNVFVVGLTEKQFKRGKNTRNPLPRNLPLCPDADDEEDILRLIYTAMTRAKSTLTLSYAERDVGGKTLVPLSVISPLIENFEMNEVPIESVLPVLENMGQNLFLGPYTDEEQSFLKDRIEKQFTMNVTALQNFLDVTRGGPSQFLANNIFRFPQAKSIDMIYGTAMHKALEDFFSEYKRTGMFQKSLLENGFLGSFQSEGFTESELKDTLNRGKEKLAVLYDDITKQVYGELQLEYDFRIIGGGVYLDDVQLTGKIDRIEIIGDGRIRITDYKTGGGFENFSGADSVKKWKYKLQLVFYALLFSLSPRWQAFPVREYELFFIEQDLKTKQFFHVIEYIQDSEVERMKVLIQKVMKKIRSLDFPDTLQYTQDIQGIRQFEDDIITGKI